MTLQRRELSINMQGHDVALLQKELMPLQFEIADDQLRGRVFGDTTLKAVIEFQQLHSLRTTI